MIHRHDPVCEPRPCRERSALLPVDHRAEPVDDMADAVEIAYSILRSVLPEPQAMERARTIAQVMTRRAAVVTGLAAELLHAATWYAGTLALPIVVSEQGDGYSVDVGQRRIDLSSAEAERIVRGWRRLQEFAR